jgi:D-alanine--poly(phosphoribitol) ligase subunit 2
MTDAKQAIHSKIVELARQLGNDARGLRYDEEIPAIGLLDSASLMELIVWFETRYRLSIEQHELTLENFGTVDAMVSFLERNSASGQGAAR